MKSLKNVLAALAFVFAIGAAFTTYASKGHVMAYRFTDQFNYCRLTSGHPCNGGFFNCQINGVSYFLDAGFTCGAQLTHNSPPS